MYIIAALLRPCAYGGIYSSAAGRTYNYLHHEELLSPLPRLSAAAKSRRPGESPSNSRLAKEGGDPDIRK